MSLEAVLGKHDQTEYSKCILLNLKTPASDLGSETVAGNNYIISRIMLKIVAKD